eukprot:6329584-Amphidinium_carterae.1
MKAANSLETCPRNGEVNSAMMQAHAMLNISIEVCTYNIERLTQTDHFKDGIYTFVWPLSGQLEAVALYFGVAGSFC